MILLGSTGSIGVNTLQIAKRFNLAVEALVAGKNISLLNEQIEAFHPRFVAIANPSARQYVKHDKVFVRQDDIVEMLQLCQSDTVVNALVGFAGLRPSIETIRLGKRLALANKESLVVAGHLLDIDKITPIDSEHFGLWYLMNQRRVSKMTITASGGAFRDTPLEQMALMGPEDALKHPNWSMGAKITIDSATMTNKLFELLEAKWLFGCDKLDAIIEPKSIIHAFIDFCDGSTTAHLAQADMKLPIAFALLKEVNEPILPAINLHEIGSFSFQPISIVRYPIWEIKEDVLQHPTRGVVLNAANEVAQEKFFKREVSIFGLSEVTKKTYRYFENVDPKNLDEVFEIDKEVRQYCHHL